MSPPLSQTWFFGKSCLGTSPVRPEYTCAVRHAPRSYAFGCPVCGEVWARRLISPSTPWFFWSICCKSCSASNPNSLSIPGSIWLSWDEEYIRNLPLPVLKAEFLNLFPLQE